MKPNKKLWAAATVLIYVSFAVGLWRIDQAAHPDAWYFMVALPVFLFSVLIYLAVQNIYRDR